MAADSENGVRVTQQVIYETLMQLKTEVAILNDKIPSEIEKTDREIADHEIRIRKLEKHMWLVAGASATLASALSTMLSNISI
jgi:hypothetical protein